MTKENEDILRAFCVWMAVHGAGPLDSDVPEELLSPEKASRTDLQVILKRLVLFNMDMADKLSSEAERTDPGPLRDRIQALAERARTNIELLRNIARRIEEAKEGKR
jgi:hypothetical protein